jgi:histidinol-phosphate aminotransferase
MGKNNLSRREFLQASLAGLSFMYLPGVGRVKAQPFGFTHFGERFGRLCYNENPLGPSPLALDAMQQAAGDAHLYPDWFSSSLENSIAGMHGVGANSICAGAGATEIIRLVADAFLHSGDEMVTATPTYSQMAYEASANGATAIHVPLMEGYMIDLERILEAVGPKTKLVSLVNPNNPLATVFHKGDMEIFMNSLPGGVVVVVDEAYHQYVHSRDYESCIRYVKQDYPMVVIRTFSKVYGLAGVRIGYSVASSGYTSMIASSQNIAMVSRLAQAAAIAAIDDVQHVNNTVTLNDQAKQILIDGFNMLSCDYIPSETNFMMFDTGMNAGSVASLLASKGFQVRVGWGMPQHIRVSTGTIDEMNQFIIALSQSLRQGVQDSGPPTFGLNDVYPNPFSAHCTIRISTFTKEKTMLSIYDVTGRKINTLVNSVMEPGVHNIRWDGKDFLGRRAASGTYIVLVQQGEFAATGRVALVR